MIMGKFQFANNNVELDIAGKRFIIPGTVEYAIKIKEFGLAAAQYAQQLKERDDEEQALRDGIQFMRSSLDTILGDGAAEQIFADREDNLYDYVDIMQYISDEFAQFQKQKQSRYAPNRAQRRTGARTTSSAAVDSAAFSPPVLPIVSTVDNSPECAKTEPLFDISALANNPNVMAAVIQAVLSGRQSREFVD